MLQPPTSQVLDPARHFAAIVHDVAPQHGWAVRRIVAALGPLVGDALMAAVVPCWHGQLGEPVGPAAADPGWRAWLREAFGEVLQHGATHRQDRLGLIAAATGRANELSGLSLRATRQRLAWGRAVLADQVRGPVAGFVAPAWQSGRASLGELARLGFRYRADLSALRPVAGPALPLTTWSWDWGLLGGLGRLAELGAATSHQVRPQALPCVVVHPADVARGFLPRAVGVIDRLRTQGRSPVRFADLVARAEAPGVCR